MGSRFSRASNALPPSLAKVVQKSESEGDLLQTTLRNYKNLDFHVKTTEIKSPNVSKQTTIDIDTTSKPVSGTVQSERNKKSREIKKEDVSRIMPKQDPKVPDLVKQFVRKRESWEDLEKTARVVNKTE